MWSFNNVININSYQGLSLRMHPSTICGKNKGKYSYFFLITMLQGPTESIFYPVIAFDTLKLGDIMIIGRSVFKFLVLSKIDKSHPQEQKNFGK